MCNFTPSAARTRPDISPELVEAFNELRLAAAIKMGWDPADTEISILRHRPKPNDFDPEYLKDTEAFDD